MATGLKELLVKMVDLIDEADHATGWISSEGKWSNGSRSEVFVFMSWNEETSKRVREVLEREGLLCDTDLGFFP